MSSANRRLVIFLSPVLSWSIYVIGKPQTGNISVAVLTFPTCFSRASDMIRSRKILKRVGDRRHPCLIPTVVLHHSPMLTFIWNALVALS